MESKKRIPSGTPPGSLIFTGKQKLEKPQITITRFNETLCQAVEFNASEIPEPAENFITWYDVRGLHEVEIVEKLGSIFHLHPLLMEDVLDIHQRPKFEEYESGLFLVLRALKLEKVEKKIIAEQVAIYAGKNVVLTFQEDEDDLFEGIRERIHKGKGRIRIKGADYLAYALSDNIIDNYFITLDFIGESIEILENEISAKGNSLTKKKIYDIKQQILICRKAVIPLREAINSFSKSNHALIHDQTDLYLRDLYDHSLQMLEIIEAQRESLHSLHDLYLAELSMRMNNTIQTLTIISTIFIPLTFLVGVYGMNFDVMPELHWRYGYFLVWVTMAIITIGMILYFKKNKWI